MTRGPSRGALRHLALTAIVIGVAWHFWWGSPAGLVLAAALAAHGVAAALGYRWLRRRLR